MGGESYKCPFCDKWTLTTMSLRMHLKSKHWIVKCSIEGTGPNTRVTDCVGSYKEKNK